MTTSTTAPASLTLYQGEGCPFCARVTAAMRQLNLSFPIKDVWRDTTASDELAAGGGRTTVPCLRITEKDGSVRWMYESADIISYLQNLPR